jgi:hypothetical protein
VILTSVPLDRAEQGSSVVAFASVILGSLLQGDSLPIALERVLGSLKAPLTAMTYELADW